MASDKETLVQSAAHAEQTPLNNNYTVSPTATPIKPLTDVNMIMKNQNKTRDIESSVGSTHTNGSSNDADIV